MLRAQCDGNRPKCGRCQKNDDTCLYEVNRRDIARLQLMSDSDSARLQNLNILFAVLQHGTDEQAAELLAQIRLGKSTEILASTYDIPSFHRSTSVPYETSAVFPGGPSTCDDPEDPSTAGMSSGYPDLLDRNNWTQSAETATSYNQIIDVERAELVHDSTQITHSHREHPY
ncbi:hypothetical protein F5B19DRAFT_442345 [Rostrohypoxylon terebratum]|nr:hypothetical protein F5B19DRAFT_442345 [Rostrohypoxylon terebratum]